MAAPLASAQTTCPRLSTPFQCRTSDALACRDIVSTMARMCGLFAGAMQSCCKAVICTSVERVRKLHLHAARDMKNLPGSGCLFVQVGIRLPAGEVMRMVQLSSGFCRCLVRVGAELRTKHACHLRFLHIPNVHRNRRPSPAQLAQKRLPISCEPCRVYRMRCS